MGLYMVQPYEPGKIPVLLVHGLWSTPMTWMEMFNDLRSQPEIRDRYQFWFYLYPTAQPFWLSAAQLRRDLAKVRNVLDPRHEEPALDQMVLIGHSMGGLISRLQTVQSGDEFWRLVSREPLPQIKAEPEVRQKLQETFFFQPNPSIRRVVTIGTPFHGSTLLQPDHAVAAGAAHRRLAQAARPTAGRNCSATTRGHFPTARCCGSTPASTRWRPTRRFSR